MKINFDHTDLVERFIRYVKIDTQSDPGSMTIPSTEKQKDLARLLVWELIQMGVTDAELDDFGYVYASIPATTSKKNIPVICFCAHMDTSPDYTGKNVHPVIHKNYQGGDIVLPGDATKIIKPGDHPALKDQIGQDIITSDGTTLLGADNKAGVAAIMNAAKFLLLNPHIEHGTIRLLFTPDEEIGRGVDKVNMQKLGADFGYTIDGETLGHIEDETFSADGATVTIFGIPTHPGFAKDKMKNAIKIAAEFIDNLPKEHLAPETTEKREGFIHPVAVAGSMEKCEVSFILRDFVTENLKLQADKIKKVMDSVINKYPGCYYEMEVREQYRNMKEILRNYPIVAENAMEAMHRAGLDPVKGEIRGGTDGSRLSFMGLPCPNIFAGEHAFHSPLEWVSVRDMEKASETIVHLAMIWYEQS